jgi:archaellin
VKTQRTYRALSRSKSFVLGAAAAAASILGVSGLQPAQAANVVLNSGNSSVTINSASSAGVQDWTINGQNQINQEWFWFSIGNQTGQTPLNDLGTPKTKKEGGDTVVLTYPSDDGIQVTLTYSLNGGQSGSHSSDLTDSISTSMPTSTWEIPPLTSLWTSQIPTRPPSSATVTRRRQL